VTQTTRTTVPSEKHVLYGRSKQHDSAAVDEPYWQSRVLRRRHDQRSRQMGLFEEH